MSVYRHPSKAGAWIIKISHGRKEKATYLTFIGDEDAARTYEKEVLGLKDINDPLFGDYLPEFRQAYKNRSATTSYDSLLISLAHLGKFFGAYKIRHIKPALVEQYKAARLTDGVKKRTINVELSAMSAYFRWVNESKGAAFSLPKLFTRKETTPPLPQVLTPREMGMVLDHLDGDVRLIVELMGLCGLRRNEALNLTADDIDLDGNTIRVLGKGGKWRQAPVAAGWMIDSLAERCRERPTGPLFPSPHDASRPRKDIRKPLRRAAAEAGITKEIRPHLFRHSFGAALVNSGTDIRIIQELLGHSELTTTMLYTQVAGAPKRAAITGLAAMVAKLQAPETKG